MIYLKLEWDKIPISVGLQKIFGDKWKKLNLVVLYNILNIIVRLLQFTIKLYY